MSKPKICLIGDVVIDVTLKTSCEDTKLRMGGIIHAARGFWALDVPFAVAYFAPAYLDAQINKYLNALGCYEIIKLGNVNGAPYVFLIEDAKEAGDQGYEFLLRDEIDLEYNFAALHLLKEENYTDYLIISGNYDLITLINSLEGNIHIDVANNIKDYSSFENMNDKVNTIFISTSSLIFKNLFNTDFKSFASQFEKYCKRLILKENRGGSRGSDFFSKEIVSIPAQTRTIVHSIGVGDVYDATYVGHYPTKTMQEVLGLSSWIASEYAITTYPDDFKKGVGRILQFNLQKLIQIKGISLPWEIRKKLNIYIAAPDFDFVDTSPIDRLVNSLQYHNFNPRRPIRENGQMENGATKARRQELFNKDMILLDECSILIAVLLYNDPGTLIEIGYAAARGIPVIVFDPYKEAANCMLTELPILVSHDLDEIVAEVFIQSSNLKFNE